MFPTLVLFGLSGVVNSMLNAFDEFFVPALAPGRVERRDRRDPGRRLAVLALDQRPAVRLRDRHPGRHGRAVPAAAAAPARARRAPALLDRHVRPGGPPRVPADAAGLARARADQRQPARRHVVRDPRQPRARAGRDRQGVPHLHAAAGHVLGRGRDGRVPGALASRERARRAAATGARSARRCARSRSCSSRRPSPSPCSRSRWCGSSTSTAASTPRRRTSSRRRSPRSRSASRSTASC